jgi:uncharacterized membrane protein
MTHTFVQWVTHALEIVGVSIIVVGAFATLIIFLRRLLGGGDRLEAFTAFRSNLGRSILLGLEFLIAADIVYTVAIEPSLNSVAVLAAIVAVRTFLSFSLSLEIEGRWPWQRGDGRRQPPR